MSYQTNRLKQVAQIIISLLILGFAVWNIVPYITQYGTQQFTSTTTSTTISQHNINSSEIETQIFKLINMEREKRGLQTLQKDNNLASIAKSWSKQIAQTRFLSHGNFTQRLVANGIYTFGYKYGEIIESCGKTSENSTVLARIFVDGWLSSEGHREIMLMPLNGYMGVGVSGIYTVTLDYCELYGVVDFKFMG